MQTKSFEEYLGSYEVEDSWVVRSFLGIPDNQMISEEDFNKTCKILDSFKIYDMKQVDPALDEIYGSCYNLQKAIIPQRALDTIKTSNTTSNPVKTAFETLGDDVKKKFSERTHWDLQLYKKYLG